MTNMKSTKRALILSALSLVLCFSMLIGTTYAWFTDSVSSGNNVIVAGNLDAEFKYWDTQANDWADVQGAKDIFNPNAYWEPGYAEVVYLKVSNVGTLAMKYRLALNVLGQTTGLTKEGEEIKLSDYLNFAIVSDINGQDKPFATRAEAIGAVGEDEVHTLTEVAEGDNHALARRNGEILAEGEDQYFAVVVWMPTTVGNEANHDGKNVPSIDLGLSIVATQYTAEEDAFDDQYDANAEFPVIGSGTTTVNRTAAGYEIHIRNNAGAKIGSAVISANSVADDAANLKVNMNQIEIPGNITVETGYEALSYDISVEGIKENNPEEIKMQVRIAKDLDPATVVMYHNDQVIESTYNPHTGYVTFFTATFSPFTCVYDPNSEYVPPVTEEPEGDENPSDLPVANVVPYTPTEEIVWGSYGQWSPTEGLDAELEAIYQFACTENVEEAKNSPYANWYCDFVIVLDKELGANEIFLGGNYGSFGWVGFHNGDLELEANTEVPLLGSVISNPWTYLDVVQNVGEFICGVGDVDDALAGATFTVMLRLTNPDDENEFYNVATITHQFTGATQVTE